LKEIAMRSPTISLAIAFAALGMGNAVAIEEANYRLVRTDGNIEIRDYEPSIVAETVVDGEFEDAGNRAFRKLFKYIDGNNVAQEEIAMTAPVSQARSEKIAMTSPVGQRSAAGGWAVSFMMPAQYTMETIPRPRDESVVIREIPPYRAAAIRYSGFWSEENFRKNLAELESWIETNGFERAGEPVWARYDAPFKPWFMRRNEILIPIVGGKSRAGAD
jgi:effector-binding domain-containing protein